MSDYNQYTGIYDVQVVENGLISRWTTPDGDDILCVYEDCDNDAAVTKLGNEIVDDINSLLDEWSNEAFVSRYKITLTVENLSGEGGAA